MELSESLRREIADSSGWVTASSGQGGECLEAKHLSDGRIALRDTEQPDAEPWVIRRAVWDRFVAGAKGGIFDF
ncbi:hypothetical protein GCM10009850_006110 [Nonomuraea monospora]|uniref:DUF397 domain-containing protein n=1 Tax=Nonomuraea monospora TaxID=568818 RepID=A0ABN3C762_9ACTN